MDRRKLSAGAALIAVLGIGGGVALAAQGEGGAEGRESEGSVPAGAAKVDRAAAERAALGAVPGEVRETELERESGGVVYEVEVLAPDGSSTEVTVDAGDGRVLGQEREGDEGSETND